MGLRNVPVKQSAAQSIASIAWFIESKGMIATAEKFTDNVYDYFIKLADARISYAICHDPQRAMLGLKCVPFKKKYTVAFIETDTELIICEFIPSKLIHW